MLRCRQLECHCHRKMLAQFERHRQHPVHHHAWCCRPTQLSHQNLPLPPNRVVCATTAATLWTAGNGALDSFASTVSVPTFGRIIIQCMCVAVGVSKHSVDPNAECSMRQARMMMRMTMWTWETLKMGNNCGSRRHDTRVPFNAKTVTRNLLALLRYGSISASHINADTAAACAKRTLAQSTNGSSIIRYAVQSRRLC